MINSLSGGDNTRFTEAAREILERLDIEHEYRGLGLRIVGRAPAPSGWVTCRAMGRNDKRPSAAINIGQGKARGRYKDHGGDGLSFFDFAAKFGGFADWRAARAHYANKVDVALPARLQSTNSTTRPAPGEKETNDAEIVLRKLGLISIKPMTERITCPMSFFFWSGVENLTHVVSLNPSGIGEKTILTHGQRVREMRYANLLHWFGPIARDLVYDDVGSVDCDPPPISQRRDRFPFSRIKTALCRLLEGDAPIFLPPGLTHCCRKVTGRHLKKNWNPAGNEPHGSTVKVGLAFLAGHGNSSSGINI
jgi:hypothetical protein